MRGMVVTNDTEDFGKRGGLMFKFEHLFTFLSKFHL